MWDKVIREDDVTELPPVTRKIFLAFYNMAGGSIAHPNNLKRLNEFVRHAHAKRIRLSSESFKQLLLRIGCAGSCADKLSDIYYYDRELLKR